MSKPDPWMDGAHVPIVDIPRAKRGPVQPGHVHAQVEDPTAKRKHTLPRHIFYTWIWLTLLSICIIILFIFTLSANVGHSAPSLTRDADAQTLSPSSSNRKIHAYPFNVYDATPGKVSRYPSSDVLGITKLVWEHVSWYRVCCKSNNVFQCFPTDLVALRKVGANVFLELKYPPIAATNSGSNWDSIGGVGSRCTLYWVDGKISVEN